MGAAPRLADDLARRPAVLEGVLAADFFREPPPGRPTCRPSSTARWRGPATSRSVSTSPGAGPAERKFQIGVLSLQRG